MPSKKKIKRELVLNKVILAKRLLVKYSLGEGWGVFFAIGRRNANAVKRNKIKRLFREALKKELSGVSVSKFSVCLISKKQNKFKDIDSELQNEIKNLATKVARECLKNTT